MRKIVDGIFAFSSLSPRFGYDFNGHFVEHASGNVLVDPVRPGDEDLAAFEARGVARIVLTNRNHYRDAARLRERLHARVAVHPADAAQVKEHVAVDDALAHGERVGPFVVVAAAGKSPGEVALHWPERRILIVGDACVAPAPGALALLPPAVIEAQEELRRSLARLAAEVDFDTLLVGDGHSILGGAKAALAALVATFATPGATPIARPVAP